MSFIRGAALSVVAAVLLTATVGCGSSDGVRPAKSSKVADERSHGSITQALQLSAKKSQEANSAAFVTTMVVTGREMPEGVEFSLSGVMGWDPMAADVTMDLDEMSALLGEEGLGSLTYRWVDNVVYVGGPAFEEMLDGRQWIKIELEAVLQELDDAGLDDSELDQLTSHLDNMSQSPAEQIAMLLESPEVEWKGERRLDGVDTDLYQGTLSLEDLLEAGGAADLIPAEDFEQVQENWAELGFDAFDVSVWVDERDYPVRIDMDMELPGEGGLALSSVYSDYGVPIEIDHPSAGDVVDFRDLEFSPWASGDAEEGEWDEEWDEEEWDAWLEEQEADF